MIKLIKKSGRHKTRDSPMPIGISANEHWSPLVIEKHKAWPIIISIF